MFCSLEIDQVIGLRESERAPRIRELALGVLSKINAALEGSRSVKLLSRAEMEQIAANVGAIFSLWTERLAGSWSASLPAGLEGDELQVLHELQRVRRQAAALVISSVLEERLYVELQLARGNYKLGTHVRTLATMGAG